MRTRGLASVGVGWKLFHRENPLGVLLLGAYAGQVCMAYFYTLLGAYVAPERGPEFFLVGGVVLAMTYMTIGYNTDVPLSDKWEGTYWRLSRSGVQPMELFLWRSLPMIVHGVAISLVAAVLVGLAAGQLHTGMEIVRAAPVLLVLALSTNVVGLTVVAPAIGTRYDVLTYNLMTTVVVLFSGAIVPSGANVTIDAIGTFVPLRNGLAALRALLLGEPWGRLLLREVLLALVWFAIGTVTYRLMDARGRRTGLAAFR